jgi:hypothetical protein
MIQIVESEDSLKRQKNLEKKRMKICSNKILVQLKIMQNIFAGFSSSVIS